MNNNMNNLEEARRVRRNMLRQLHRLTTKARNGDKKAPLTIIQKMTQLDNRLADLGYRMTNENEPGRPGRLVPLHPQPRTEPVVAAAVVGTSGVDVGDVAETIVDVAAATVDAVDVIGAAIEIGGSILGAIGDILGAIGDASS